MPTIGQVKRDKLLGNLSAKYRNIDFIADKVFPFIPVKLDSDLYRVYDRDFRTYNSERAMGAESNVADFNVSSASYVLKRKSLKEYIPDPLKENYEIGDLLGDATEDLTDKILREFERETMNLFTTTSWSQNASLAAAALWSANTTVSNPILPVDTGTSAILKNSGMRPTVGMLNHDAFEVLKNHVSILDRVKYTSAEVSETMIAGLFGLQELLIARAARDTSEEGATSSISYMLDDVFWLGVKGKPGLKYNGAGATFRKATPLVKRWRDEPRESDVVEVNMSFVPKIINSLSGYLIKNVI